MERIFLQFDFSDKDIPDIIANSTPPKGVKVGKPAVFIQASSVSGGVFVQLVIQFVHDAAFAVLAAWLYECCVKSGKKKGRVNHDQIVYSERNIRRIIKKELKNQRARNAQRRHDKNRPPKKRP
jgi:hypothetical protein